MNKPRKDSTLSALTGAQTETLEGWLFEDRLPYNEIEERLRKEFGLKVARSSLSRFYQRAAANRAQAEFLRVTQTVQELEKTPLDSEVLGEVAMQFVAKRLIQVAVEKPEKIRVMATLARVMVAHRSVEIKNSWLEMEQDRVRMEAKRKELADARHAGTLEDIVKSLAEDPISEESEENPEESSGETPEP